MFQQIIFIGFLKCNIKIEYVKNDILVKLKKYA